jgi:hypothetical protein
MANTYVSYDRRSGQILGVHYGAGHADDAKKSARRLFKKVPQEHLEVFTIEAGGLETGKHYRVDLARKVLVSSSPEEAGVHFGFGKTGSVSSSKSGSGSSSKKG